MIIFRQRGDFANTERFFKMAKRNNYRAILQKYAAQGVTALVSATPQDSGLTADSWNYEITISRSGYRISWTNSNVKEGVPIAILIQYGHGTKSGVFVPGRDYINPAMRPIFEQLSENLWKEIINV